MFAERERTVLVTGASGTLGRHVTRDLSRRGMAIIGMGRGAPPAGWRHDWFRGDMADAGVLRSAARDADTIVHCATDPRSQQRDVKMVRELVEVCGNLDRHLVHVSIAGIEEATASRYYAGKLEGERLLRTSGVPHALIRSTQFHQFMLSMLRRLELPALILCPCISFQPVDPDHVADVIGRSVEQRAVVEATLNGPERLPFRESAKAWLRHRRVRRLRLPMPAFGPLAPMASLTVVDGLSGGLSWAQWLAHGGEDA